MKVHFALLAAAAVLLYGTSTLAAQLDSALFSHQYNGDVYPLPDYTEEGAGNWTTPPSTDGDILSFQAHVGDSNALFESDLWSSAVSDAAGWTLETRLKIENDATEGEAGAMQMFLGDGGNTTGKSRMAIRIGQSVIRTNTGVDLSTSNNSDDFHTIRVAQVGGSNEFRFWRDGIALPFVADGSHAIASGFWWGDGGSSIGGPTVRVDYLRFDNTGGYEPVTAPPAVPGDFDGDGDVDGADFVAWQTHFPTSSGATLATGDADGDGDVDGADFVVWQTHFPTTSGLGVSTIPEPSALMLGLLSIGAGVGLIRGSRGAMRHSLFVAP